MRQDFKGKGIKGVNLMQLTTSREPWNEGYHLKHTDVLELSMALCSSLCLCSVGGDPGWWRREEEGRMDMGESPGKNYTFSVIVSVTCLLWEMIKT